MKVNKLIYTQPIVFFLGAGSSVPLGMPTTLSFRQVLLSKSSKIEKLTINALYKMAAYRYRVSENDINLEQFLEFLHELRLGFWILSRSSLSKHVSATLSKINSSSWADADRKVNRVRWKILEVLHDVCGDCSGQRAAELWDPLLFEFQRYTKVFPLFTLNYDWTFEKACIAHEDRFRLTDGFSGSLGGAWSSGYFAEFQPSEDRVDICLFKLHGSTCWVGDIKSLGPFSIAKDRPKYGFESEDSTPFEIVYPGYRREVWLGKDTWNIPQTSSDVFVGWRQREPYSVLYRYFDLCLSRAKVVIVIGYAFGDRDINARLAKTLEKNSLCHLVVVGPGNRSKRKLPTGVSEVVYEAPYSWDIDFMDLAPEAWNKRLHWIRGKFGTKTARASLLAMVNEILGQASSTS